VPQMHLWLERITRALIDFIAVQLAGILSLVSLALPAAFGVPG